MSRRVLPLDKAQWHPSPLPGQIVLVTTLDPDAQPNVAPPLVDRVWALADLHGAERRERAGLTLVPASRVAPPLVEECSAHLECAFVDEKRFGDEVLVFGRVLAVSVEVDDDGAPRAAFFLESGLYAPLGPPDRVDRNGRVQSGESCAR